MITTDALAAPPLKLMPIDFVGEWCNGETIQGETNWKLPSWIDDGSKCTNILSVTKYDFSFEIDGKPFSCVPDTISQSTAPSGTSYQATISAHCRGDGPVTGPWTGSDVRVLPLQGQCLH
ncbi:hypothetical protein CWO90_08750 [Bradyrhizobium sp. Leo121]|nr:hypothetical protein CWO90_08750 [Bradyrhizobium sp. Leo121]